MNSKKILNKFLWKVLKQKNNYLYTNILRRKKLFASDRSAKSMINKIAQCKTLALTKKNFPRGVLPGSCKEQLFKSGY